MKHLIKIIQANLTMLMAIFVLWQGYLFADEVKIAVIDSGASRYVDSARSFTTYKGNHDPLNHGTEIAKLIREENPSAQIHMLQVCEKIDGDLQPSAVAVLGAIQWAVDNQVDIINMSLVMRYDPRIEEAIEKAAQNHGIIFVAAAGNRTLSSHFAVDEQGYVRRAIKTVNVAFPASNKYVISVGALDRFGDVAEYSGQRCDFYAQGGILGQEGSSFACARVTAKVAQFLKDQPHARKDAILSALK